MNDYEIGRKARCEGEPLHANPYWGWFRRAAWERGWLEQERVLATPTTAKLPRPLPPASTRRLASA
jgi:hypothetical protein